MHSLRSSAKLSRLSTTHRSQAMTSRMMLRKQLERQAKRLLTTDHMPEFQVVWVCKAYAQAKLSDAEDVCDVEIACAWAGEGESGEQAVLVAVCDLLGIDIPLDYTG